VDSVWELFGPLLAGARLVGVEERLLADPVGLVGLLAAERVSRLVAVPSFLRLLVELAGERLSGLSLREVVSSGEPLPGELAGRLRALLPAGCRLLNLYGSTEVAADATWFEITGEPGERVPIGRPLDNVCVYVLGPGGEPLPLGAVGELAVGGAGLALGYLGRAAAEGEQRFLPDQLSGRPGQRLYRTGDLGRWRPDGQLEYLGRADRQVKIRGVRVEPAELEQTLPHHPHVREAAVVARPGPDGTQLLAFLTPTHPDTNLDTLHAYLRTRLPDQLIPAHLAPLDQLPRLPHGKIDRTTLADQYESLVASVARSPVTAPRSAPIAPYMGCQSHLSTPHNSSTTPCRRSLRRVKSADSSPATPASGRLGTSRFRTSCHRP